MSLISLGTRFDGSDMLFEFPGEEASALVSGVTGSGKTKLVESFLGATADMADVALIVIDLKGGVGFQRWEPRLTGLVTSPGQATDLLWQISQIIKQRMNIMTKHHLDVWDPTLGPYVILVIDELAELAAMDDEPLLAWLESDRTKPAPKSSNGGKVRLTLLASIARLCRAFGIRLWCATQYPIAEIVPTELRSNLVIRFAHRVTGNEQVDVALGEGFGKLIPHPQSQQMKKESSTPSAPTNAKPPPDAVAT